MPDGKKTEWFYSGIPMALGSGDSVEKMCLDLCDTGPCVSGFQQS